MVNRTLEEYQLPQKKGRLFSEVLLEQSAYDEDNLRSVVRNVRLNAEQQAIADIVLDSSASSSAKNVHFIDARCGRGKTFLMNYLAAAVRFQGSASRPKIVLSHGTTGIVALMFDRGSTEHSRFSIPIVAQDDGTFICKPSAARKELLKAADLIIIDEIGGLHREVLNAINKLLQELSQQHASHGRSSNLARW